MTQYMYIVDQDEQRAKRLCGLLTASDMPAKITELDQALALLKDEYEDIAAIFVSAELPRKALRRFFHEREMSVERSSVPVIALASEPNASEFTEILDMGATDVYVVPFNPAIVKRRLQNLMSLRESVALRRAIEHDPVTGICNREAFYKKTSLLISRNIETDYTLLYMDVDHFKVINELFGAETGDRILRAIADKLKEHYHNAGTYCRLESDRFALCAPREKIDADRLLTEISHHIEDMDINYTVNLYAGVYEIDEKLLPVDQMCDRAALALRTVKGNYFTRYAVYDNRLRDTLLTEQQIVSEMSGALESGQFCIYLQPLYSITTGEPISAEALVRWQHPQKGLISPGLFIPLFERNGFITKLDHYVWDVACRYLSETQAEGKRPLPVSVNVSRMNLYNPRLCEEIVALTEKHGVDPKLLKLEITESAYTDNPRQLLSAMKKLHQHGFEILMDDFGSGYSSLNMLKDVPVDILKIDMRFLDDMESSGRAGNVMTSIVRMAKWLNMVVVAEGVETKAQIDFLRSIGCDKVQGFYYARPLPVDQFKALMLNPAMPKSREEEAFQLEDYDFDAIWESNKSFNLLFNGMIGGMGIYELSDGNLEPIRVNAAYYELMNATPQTMFGEGKNALSRVHPDDREPLLLACRRAMRSHQVEQLQIRRLVGQDRRMWLDVKIRFLGNAAKRELYYFALNDVTRQKELERGQSLQTYGMAILSAYDEAREINFTDDTITEILRNKETGEFRTRQLALPSELNRYALARVHPEDREAFIKLHEAARLAQKQGAGANELIPLELRLLSQGGEVHWARLRLYELPNSLDKRIFLSCTRMIDEEKNAERIREENRTLQIKQREQQRYQTIVEQTDTAVLEYNVAERTVYTSALAAQYALSQVDLYELFTNRLSPDSIVLMEDASVYYHFIDRARGGERSVTEELRLRRLDGTTPWCRVHGLFEYQGEKISRAICTISDIDQQTLAERRLERQREDNLRQLGYLTRLYLTVPCGIVHFSMEDKPRIVYNNRACQEIFGFSSKEAFLAALKADPKRFMPEQTDEDFLASVRSSCKTGAEADFERRILKKDGSEGYISGITSVDQDIDGNAVVQTVFLDISTRKQQEKSLRDTQDALKRTTEELNTLLDNLPVGVGIFTIGETPRAEYLNGRVYDMYGVEQPANREISLAMLPLLFQIPPDRIQAALDDPRDRIYTSNRHHSRRADGSMFWMRSYATLIRQPDGSRICYAVLADVTHQIERERDFGRQSELYRILMDESGAIFFDYDGDNDKIVYSVPMPSGRRENRQLTQYLATLHQSVIMHPDYVDKLIQSFRASLRRVMSGDVDFLADFFGKGFRWYRAFYRSIADEMGAVYRCVGRLEDINDEKRSQELLQQERIYKNAIAAASMFVFRFDLDTGDVTMIDQSEDCEKRFLPLESYTLPEKIQQYVHPDDLDKLREALTPSAALTLYHGGASASRTQGRLKDKSGQWVWVEMTLHLMLDESTDKVAAIGYLKEIEDQKKLEMRASFDEMTGVLNRAATQERISLALLGATTSCYLFIFDVDDFKAVNDRYGHVDGDRLLQLISQTLKAHFRITDIVGRIGGDEFAALLYGVVGRHQVISKAQEIMLAIGSLRAEADWPQDISLSMGIACSPKDGNTFDELYRAADRALYRAKDAGKGQFRFTDEE